MLLEECAARGIPKEAMGHVLQAQYHLLWCEGGESG